MISSKKVMSGKSPGYLLGIDTGTSKTHALVSTCAGEALGYGVSGCGNYEVVGIDQFKKVMIDAANSALAMAGIEKDEIICLGCGISGYDWPSEEPIMVEAIQALGFNCKIFLENDVTIGLIAGSTNGWGVAVDAGTGNNVRGRDRYGNIGRITGNSVWHGEIGGGGEMVWLAQVAVTHAWTQRAPKTKLTQAFMDFSGTKTEFELIEGLATNQIHLPPILAEEIYRLAANGDQVALQIINTSAHELAQNVNAVIRQLNIQGESFDLVLIGGIFKAGEPFLGTFQECVKKYAPKAQLVHLTLPPVVGAVLLAAKSLSLENEKFKQELSTSVRNIWVENGSKTDPNFTF